MVIGVTHQSPKRYNVKLRLDLNRFAHYLIQITGRIQRVLLRPSALIARTRLRDTKSTVCKSVAAALGETLKNRLTLEEKSWINKIESLRKELTSSHKPISIVDYGAVSGNKVLKHDDIYEGNIVVRSVSKVCRSASMPSWEGCLLFKLIRELQPSVCLELGTCLGISAAYQAAALKLNQSGSLITLEGAESLASIARQSFDKLGFDNVQVVIGKFQDNLHKTLSANAPVNFAFIDGHHDGDATLAYFEQIYSFTSEQALLVFDDIRWSKNMRRAWTTIRSDDRINYSVDLWWLGICIIDKTAD